MEVDEGCIDAHRQTPDADLDSLDSVASPAVGVGGIGGVPAA